MRIAVFVVIVAAAPGPAGASGPVQDAPDPAREAGALLGRGHLAQAEAAARSCAAAGAEALRARCALVLGRALFGSGDASGAAGALRGARGKLGSLEAVAAQLEGEALLISGAAAQAQELLREAISLAPASPSGVRAAALLADALLAAGDDDAARAQAERATELPGQQPQIKAGLALTRAEALAGLARADAHVADATRTRAAALAALQAARAFWLEHPDHPAAALMPGREAELGRLAGGPLAPSSGHDLGLRASRLLSAGLPSAAVAQAREAQRKLSGSDGAEVDLLLARALAADGRRAEAGPALEAAWRSGAPHVASAAGLLLARDRARKGKPLEAVALLDELARRYADAPELDEAEYLAARLLLEQPAPGKGGPDRRADARKRLLKLGARRRGNWASDARWAIAWLSYKAQGKDAPELFAAFAAGALDDEGRAQGLYWQSRAGMPDAAPPLLARVAALDPLGWYGLLAAQRPSAAAPAFPPRRPAPPAPPGELALAMALLDLGLTAEAAGELDRYVQLHHGHAVELLPALAAYERAGRYDRSVVLAQNLVAGRQAPLEFRTPGRAAQGAQDPTARALLEAAYPAAYPELVAASARRAGLDPYFVLAVARRESLFRPDVRSAAGAVGLLQLTPATARRAAAVLGRPAGSDDDLFDPANAIDLGSWYLSELIGRFGDAAIAAAAYNAGPRSVGPWAASAAGERLDAWVEDIPFRETRRYVKAVVGAWSAYRLLAGGAPPALAGTVPEPHSGVEF